MPALGKVIFSLLGGAVVVTSAGLAFNGQAQIDSTNSSMEKAKTTIASLKTNETDLLGKYKLVFSDGNRKIATANTAINGLKGTISDLKAKKAALEAEVEKLSADLAAKTKEYDDLKAAASSEASKAQSEVDRLNNELQKANDAVSSLEQQTNQLEKQMSESAPVDNAVIKNLPSAVDPLVDTSTP